MKKYIYMDNAATTQVKEAVLQSMLPFFREIYGNPSADYTFAREAKEAVEKARVKSASLLILLNKLGICASGGSACTSGSTEPSHVLTAIGLSRDMAEGALRLTLSEETNKEEIDFVVDNLKEITERLRN